MFLAFKLANQIVGYPRSQGRNQSHRSTQPVYAGIHPLDQKHPRKGQTKIDKLPCPNFFLKDKNAQNGGKYGR